MSNDDQPFDDFDAEPEEGWTMFEYHSVPVVAGTGLPPMPYAWRVWLECREQGQPVPEEIQARVDKFCRKVALKEIQSIPKKDETHLLRGFKSEFFDEPLVDRVKEYAAALGSTIEACQLLAREWGKNPDNSLMPSGATADAESIRREYYLAKKRLGR